VLIKDHEKIITSYVEAYNGSFAILSILFGLIGIG